MRWTDRDNVGTRALFWALHGSYRARRLAREVRHLNGLTVASIVFLVLGLTFHRWVLFAAFLVIVIINLTQWLYFRSLIERSRIEDVDEMTGWEFERWLKAFFDGLGFGVKTTPHRGDFGADFVLTWKTRRIAVQAKRTSQLVGVRAVQEVLAAKGYYKCTEAMVVTNSYFTDQAVILARANGVSMRSRDDLAEKAAGLRSLLDGADQTSPPAANSP